MAFTSAYTLEEARDMLQKWKECEYALASGQAEYYKVGSREYRAIDLGEIAARIQYFKNLVDSLSGNGRTTRVTRVVFRDLSRTGKRIATPACALVRKDRPSAPLTPQSWPRATMTAPLAGEPRTAIPPPWGGSRERRHLPLEGSRERRQLPLGGSQERGEGRRRSDRGIVSYGGSA